MKLVTVDLAVTRL